MILAASARPRPVPLGFVVTKGSKRLGIRSSATPGPLSLTQSSSGSETFDLLPGSDSRTPGLNAVESWISPSGALSPMASAAFLTRLRNTWTSWSRLANTGGSEGSYSSTNLMLRAKPDWASRRAANSRQRVLDLVRQHGGERDHRPRGAAMGQLPVHLIGHGALLEHHHHLAGSLRHRSHMKVNQTFGRRARSAEVDFVFIDGAAALADLLDQCQQWAAERHQVAQGVPAQQRDRHVEKILGCHIDIFDHAVGGDHDHGERQRIEDGFRRADGDGRVAASNHAHA